MRVNRPLKVREWMPILLAMPKMLRWLDRHPEAGLLNWQFSWMRGPAIIQYWRTFEPLDPFARADGQPHLPAWKAFNRSLRRSGLAGSFRQIHPIRRQRLECAVRQHPAP